MSSSELNFLFLSIAILLLVVASWQDVQSREVVDWIWLGMAGGGIILHGLNLILLMLANLSPLSYFTRVIINIITAILLALFLSILGLGGEADRIAFVAIAIISPITSPLFGYNDPRYELLSDILPRILGTFSNSYLVAIPVPLVIFSYNMIKKRSNPNFYDLPGESRRTRAIIQFIGYPRITIGLEQDLMTKPWHYDFLEEYSEARAWQISFRFQLDTPEADLARKQNQIEAVKATGKQLIWIQPSLPFILFISLGFLLDIVFGNVILLALSLVI